MDTILADALRDIRIISKGLMLPEIELLRLGEVVKRAVKTHEARTGAKVDVIYGAMDCEVSHAVKICVYRFVQEGLSNAFRHAGTDGSVVSCGVANSILSVSVLDRGGASDNRHAKIVAGLGSQACAKGWRALAVHSNTNPAPGKGTQIEMRLTIEAGEHNG